MPGPLSVNRIETPSVCVETEIEMIFSRHGFERALAVLRQIQQHLQKTVAVRLHQRQFSGMSQLQLDVGFLAAWFQHDPQIGQRPRGDPR